MEDSTYSLVEDAVPETERGSNVDTSLESQDTNTFISSSSASRFSEPGSQTERAGTHERTGQRHSAQTPALEGFSKSTSSPPSASSGHLQPVASGQEHADSLERDVLKGICNTPQRDLLENHLHFQGKPDVCEEILDSDEEMCPEDMRVDYHDAVILYQELNKSDVEKFKLACKQVRLNGISEPVIALYDEILPDLAAMTLFDNLELALSNCEFVFLYITKEFCTDAWSIFSSHASLDNAINDPIRKWSVVPVFTAHKHSTQYKIPLALKCFRGFNFFSEDKCDSTSLTKMLESRLSQRLKKQELKNQMRRQWITDDKEKRENLDAERRHQMKKQHVRVQKKDSENNCLFELENQRPDKIHRAINPTVQQKTAGVSTEEDAGNDTCATSLFQTPTETTNRSSEPPASATNLIDETAMQTPEDVSKMKDVVDDTNAKSQSQTPTETTDRSSEPPASATNLIDETAMQSPEDVSKMKDVVDDTNAKSQSQTPTETTDRSSEPPASATNLIDETAMQSPEDVSKMKDVVDDTNAKSQSQTPTETTDRSSEPPASATNLIDETAMQSPEDVSKMKDVVDDTNAKSQSQTPTETTDRSSEPPASATNLIDETAMQSPEDVSKMKDVADDTNAKSQSQTPTETTDRSSEPPASATNLIDEKAMQNHEDVSKTKDDKNGTKATSGAVKQPDKSDQPRQTHVVTTNRDNKDYDTIDALQRNATCPPQQSDSERELKDSSADGIVSLPAKKLIQKVKNEEGTTETNQQAPPRESTDFSLQTNRSALCVEKKESNAAEIIPHCSSRLNPKEGEEDGTAGIIQSLQPPGTADPPPQESVSSCVEESKPNVIGVILQDSAGVKLNQDEKEDNAHRTVAMIEFLPVVSSGIDDSASNVEPKGTDGVHTKHISSGASPMKGEVGCASAKSESSVPVVKIDPPAQLPSAQTCGKNKDVDDDQILHPAPADPNLIEGEIDNSAAMSWSTPPTEIKDHSPHPSDSCDIKKNPGGSATVQQKTAGVSPEKDAGDDACATSLSQPPTKTTDRSSEPPASPTLLLGENSDVSKTIGDVDDTNAKSQSESSIETTDCSLQPPVSASCVLDGTAQQISERVSKHKDDLDGSKATSGTLIQTENSDQPKQTHVATTDRGNTIYFTTEAFQRHLTGPQQPSDSATQGERKDSSAHSSTYFSQEVNGGDDTRKTIQPPAPRDSTDPCVQETSSAIGLEGKESSAAEGISDFSTNLNPREEDEDCTGGIIQSLQLPGTADPPTQESASFCVEERRAPITGVITQESPDVRFKEDQKEDRIVTMTESHDTCATSQYQSLTETIDRSSQPPASATNLLDETSLQNLETVSKTKDDVDSTNSTSQSLSSTDRSSEPLASATLLVDEKSLQNPGDVSKTKDDVATIDPSPQLSSSQICVESKKEGVHTAVQMTADLCPKEGKGDNANAQSCSRQPINPKKTRHRHVGQSHLARTREEGISRHTEAVPRETFEQAYQQHTSVHPETARPVASAPPSQHYQPMYPDLPQSQQQGRRHPLSEYHGQPGHGAHSQQYFHQHGDSHPLQSPAKAVHSNDGLPCGKKRARHEKKCMPLQSVVHVHYHNVKIGQADFVNISQQTDVVEERTSFTTNRDDPSRMDQDQELSEDSDTNCKLLHDGPASADIPTYDFNLPPDITTDDFTLPPGEFLLQPNSEQEAGSPDKDLREDRLIRTDSAINEKRKKTSKKRRFCCFKL